MHDLFVKLLQLSLSGSLVIFGVILVRLLFRKAPRWVFCLLWGIVALRLIVPISIESPISLVPASVANGQIITDAADRYVGNVDIYYESHGAYDNAVEAGRQPVCSQDGYYVITEKGTLDEPATVGETVFPVLGWIWMLGMGAMLSYLTISYLVLRHSMTEATRLTQNVFQCECVRSPFVLGVFRPKIYLPYHMDASDMESVIAHEQAHIRRKDHWWKPIGFLLLSVYWFNPVMWLAYILLCRDIEAACDEKVIQNMNKDEMRAYSTALLHCSVHRRRVTACPLAFGEVGVKERIRHVMNYRKPAFWIVALAVLASVIVGVLLLTEPVSEPDTVSVVEDEPSVAPDERLLELVDRIVYNSQCAASSNPFDYINAGKDQYNEILTYGDAAVRCFIEQLRAGENGLRGYVMAVACAELTGVADKNEAADWGTAQQWLAVYDKAREAACGVRISEITSASRESKLTVEAPLGKTDLSHPGEALAGRITAEWQRFDAMSQLDQVTSSHLWGTIYINTDTWSECEEETGIPVNNPLEAVDWIDETGYIGMESANPDIPVTHVQAVAYAWASSERQLSRIDITCGYHYNNVRITLTAAVCAEDGVFTTGSVRQGYATFDHEVKTSGSGLLTLVVTPNEVNNGQYHADYYDQIAYWTDGNVFYTLRVTGEEENQPEIRKTFERLLSEI